MGRRVRKEVTWLHISDLHLRGGDPYDAQVVLRALLSAVRRYRTEDRCPDLIFATGDIANAGQPVEYDAAQQFFESLLAAAELSRERLYVVPGNHDVDRKIGRGLVRTLNSQVTSDDYFDPETVMLHGQRLGAFRNWHDRYFAGIRTLPDNSTCGPVETLDINGLKIGILPLNSALFCHDDDDHDKLWIGRRCLDAACETLQQATVDLALALVHHPLEWLSNIERVNIKDRLERSVDLLLRGHLHENEIESVCGINGGLLHIAAGAAYQTRQYPMRALYATSDGQNVTLFPICYVDSPSENWVPDASLFLDDPGNERSFAIPKRKPIPPQAQVQEDFAADGRLNEFKGRQKELLLFRSMLTKLQGATWSPSILTIGGIGGIGKSALCHRLVNEFALYFPASRTI